MMRDLRELKDRRERVALALRLWQQREPDLWRCLRRAEAYARGEASVDEVWRDAERAGWFATLLGFGPISYGDDDEPAIRTYRLAWVGLMQAFEGAVKAGTPMPVQPFHVLRAAQAALEAQVPAMQAEAEHARQAHGRALARSRRSAAELLDSLRAPRA
ncbi:hypothetical protein D9M70_370320 [compost metagenome]